MPIDLILGTAGHIDHGKTSLIRALTGIDTDRLPEEKRRGITIDLGFASLELPPYRLGIVDVPGHERFVRNMLAGATAMDLAMLVVAADDSVNQQTREHLDILRLLDLRGGVIVLTKCDLVDESWLALVEQDVRELVLESPLAAAPLVRTSVVTGLGLGELRAALQEAASQAAGRLPPSEHAPFRMAIDRSFAVAGHGTVVTGSITSGRARLGDELALEPGGVVVRIRGLQSHDQPQQELHRGQRGAINLAGIHHDEVVRGQELCTPGSLVPARTLTARLSLLQGAPQLKSRSRVRLHVGTAELLASLRLLDSDRLGPGDSGLVQLHLAEPAVTTWSQPFVVRRESPLQTIGGGRVLDPAAQRIRRSDSDTREQLASLESREEVERAGATLYLAGLNGWRPEDLPRLSGVTQFAAARDALLARGDLIELASGPTSLLRVHTRVVSQLGERLATALKSMHEHQPLRAAVPRGELATRFSGVEEVLIAAAIRHLEQAGRVKVSTLGLALAEHGPKLTRGQQQLLDQLVGWFREAELQTPGLEECVQRSSKNKDSVKPLLALAAASGQLVAVGPGYWLHADVERQAREQVASALAARGAITVSEIRELLQTTRKYAVPLCEYWDRVGFTERRGDARVLKSRHTTKQDGATEN